jgi:uncharacterized membrane-anchored protein
MFMNCHPLRGAVLGELHARPFIPIAAPKRLLHLGFMTSAEAAAADRARLSAFCESRARPGPREDARHHEVVLADARLRWEQHSEFTTYTWEIADTDRAPFERGAGSFTPILTEMEQPGPLLVAVDLHLLADRDVALDNLFDPSSLAASIVAEGKALAATDFRVGSDGFVRWLMLDRGLAPTQAGALAQRLLEVETYRTLALLGLPETQGLAPQVRNIEDGLTRIARTMTERRDLAVDSRLLDELTVLAAALEADANVAGYRLRASRAYAEIVDQRLDAIDETPYPGWPTLAAFLSRRMAPAMRTCHMMEERLTGLSARLARAAQLLRTRVDVEIERQNRDLLGAMNARASLQLRLQQTVEGLSIAAISYYVVSLAGYLFEGLKDAGLGPDPALAQAVSVPFAVLIVALMVRRIRRHHAETETALGAAARRGRDET